MIFGGIVIVLRWILAHDTVAPATHFWHPDLFHPFEAQRDIRKFLQMDQDWINSRVEIHTVSDYHRFG